MCVCLQYLTIFSIFAVCIHHKLPCGCFEKKMKGWKDGREWQLLNQTATVAKEPIITIISWIVGGCLCTIVPFLWLMTICQTLLQLQQEYNGSIQKKQLANVSCFMMGSLPSHILHIPRWSWSSKLQLATKGKAKRWYCKVNAFCSNQTTILFWPYQTLAKMKGRWTFLLYLFVHLTHA